MQHNSQVFLSYSEEDREFVESIAIRLRSDVRLSFWFAPWNAIPGLPIQEQTEDALARSQVAIVFIGGKEGKLEGWQNEEVRVAIQTRVEDMLNYRIIPVLVPYVSRDSLKSLPPFLRRYIRNGTEIVFNSSNDTKAFEYLLAGILGIAPIDIKGFLDTSVREISALGSVGTFNQGHALVIGIAKYLHIRSLPDAILHDTNDLYALLTDSTVCGYPLENVAEILNEAATADGIRSALRDLGSRATDKDTIIVFFSGHGAYGTAGEYILPYDCKPTDLPGTAISGSEMTELLNDINAGRLLVVFDSCHSGGAGNPKSLELPSYKMGLSEDYYQSLAQGKGRVVIASSRTDELSWVLPGSRNSLFTQYFLSALRGEGKTLGDGYVRVFDVFRHIAEHVPTQANQHPIFKSAMEDDFAVALDASLHSS